MEDGRVQALAYGDEVSSKEYEMLHQEREKLCKC